jgi:hypothetical protein
LQSTSGDRHLVEVDVSLIQPAAATPVFIDALNLAYWSGHPPSLRMPLALMGHLLAAGHAVMGYFDASARYRLQDEAGLYERLLQYPRHFVEVPSGRTADGVMLRLATASGGCIISRDKYRDHRRRYRRLIDDPSRLMAGTLEDGQLLLPSLAIRMPLPSSLEEARARLEPFLGHPRQVSDPGAV